MFGADVDVVGGCLGGGTVQQLAAMMLDRSPDLLAVIHK
jgi:hypothetical protein